MTVLERAALSAILWATTCIGCAPHRLVPMVLRPDTRHIGVVVVDSSVMRQTGEIFSHALPHEGSVCYTGDIHDSTVTLLEGQSLPVGVLHLTGVTEAQHDSVTEAVYDSMYVMHIWYSDPPSGCALGVIAIAHSHPRASWPIACAHSLDDAVLLFADTRILASAVWCMDGREELLFQDGRRVDGFWREQ